MSRRSRAGLEAIGVIGISSGRRGSGNSRGAGRGRERGWEVAPRERQELRAAGGESTARAAAARRGDRPSACLLRHPAATGPRGRTSPATQWARPQERGQGGDVAGPLAAGLGGSPPSRPPSLPRRAHAARGLICVRAVTLRLFLRRLRARVTDAAGVAESNARLPLAGGACRSGFGGAHPPSMGPSRDAEPLLHGPGPARGPPTAGPPGGAAHSRLSPSRGRGSNQGPREGVPVPSCPPRHARPDAALALALRGLPQTPRGLPCHTQFRDSPGTRRRLGAIAEQPLVVNTVS